MVARPTGRLWIYTNRGLHLGDIGALFSILNDVGLDVLQIVQLYTKISHRRNFGCCKER
jgi:hypothetical protein